MAGVDDYSTTPNSNTTINGIDIDENCAPSGMNNAVRQLLADIRKVLNDIGAKAVSSGTDTITLTTETGYAAYADGTLLSFIAGGTCTGAATLNVDGVGAKAVLKGAGTALAAGDITAGQAVIVVYDESADGASGAWMMANAASLAAILTAIVALSSTGMIARTGAGTVSARTITASNGVAVTNGNGVSGNPAIAADIANATDLAAPATDDEILLADTSASGAIRKSDIATVLALAAVMTGDSGSGGVKGFVPAPSAGDAAAGKFLKADATWAAPSSGMTLVSNQQPTSNVTSVEATGLSSYRRILSRGAFTNLSGASPVTYSLQARTSGGTWRTIISNSLISGDSTASIFFSIDIWNFNQSAEKLIFVQLDEESNVLDDSDAFNGQSSGPLGSFTRYASYNEVWDEFRILSDQASSIAGTTADQRGRMQIYGV